MRAKHTALFLTAGFLLIPTITLSQGPGGRGERGFGGPGGERGFGPPGGGGYDFRQGGAAPGTGGPPGMGGGGMRGGRMMMDPDAFFDQYSKDGRTLRKEDLPESMQRMIQFAGPMMGLTGDSWTRDQLKSTTERLRSQFGQFAPGGGGMPGMGGGGPPGLGGGADGDRRLEEAFKRLDKNEDGVLDNNEMSDTLRDGRDQFDPNHDGVISLEEFKSYVAARRGDGDSDRERRDGEGPRRPRGEDDPAAPEIERRRPSVVRAGNMPREFPFADLDRDSDGQVGLYEWKEAGRTISQFLTMDLNNDGFLTVDEYLRWKRQGDEQLAKSAGSQGGAFGRWGQGMGGMNPGMMAFGPGGNRWGGNGGGGFGGMTGMPGGMQWGGGQMGSGRGQGGQPGMMNFRTGGDQFGGGFRGQGGPGSGMMPGGFGGMSGGGGMPGGFGMTGGGFRGQGMMGPGMDFTQGGGFRGQGMPGSMMPSGFGMNGGGGSGINLRGPGGPGGDRGPRGMGGPGGERGQGGDREPGGPGGRGRGNMGGDNGGQGNMDRGPGGPGNARRRPGG